MGREDGRGGVADVAPRHPPTLAPQPSKSGNGPAAVWAVRRVGWRVRPLRRLAWVRQLRRFACAVWPGEGLPKIQQEDPWIRMPVAAPKAEKSSTLDLALHSRSSERQEPPVTMAWCVPPTTRAAERTSNRHISLDTCDRAPQARANQLELSWDGEVAVVACYDTHARTAYIKHVLMQASHCRVGPNRFFRLRWRNLSEEQTCNCDGDIGYYEHSSNFGNEAAPLAAKHYSFLFDNALVASFLTMILPPSVTG